MNYFTNLPEIDYTIDDTTASVRNIFNKLNIDSIDEALIKVYRINGIKRLDTISYEIYGTDEYWWLIALLNNFQDIIFDLPINEDIIREITKNKTLAKYETLLSTEALNYYNTTLDELITENDAKRIIKIIDSQYMSSVISSIAKGL